MSMQRTTLFFVGLLFAIPLTLEAATFYVSPSGSDSTSQTIRDGSLEYPWRTPEYALSQCNPGDTLILRGGVYAETSRTDGTFVNINKNLNASEESQRITLEAYEGETPVVSGVKPLTSWTQASDDDPYLTVGGVVNPNYANIYFAEFEEGDCSVGVSADDLLPQVWAFEDYEFLIPCHSSNQQGIIINQTEMHPVGTETAGQTEKLVDSTRLTQVDDYWKDAKVLVWLHGNNNNMSTRFITGSSQSEKSMTFGGWNGEAAALPASLRVTGTSPDAYSILNHPHLLTRAGTFYYTPRADENGKFRLYVWPKDKANLTNGKTGISKYKKGFYFQGAGTGNTRGFFTFSGIEMVGFCGLSPNPSTGAIVSSTSGAFGDIKVEECFIHDVSTHGVCLTKAYNITISSDTVIQRVDNYRALDFGYGGRNIIIKDCDLGYSTRTVLFVGGCDGLQVLRSKLHHTGLHGQALSMYTDPATGAGTTNVLIAHCEMDIDNYITLTANTLGKALFFGNTIVSRYPYSTWAITDWATGTGDQYFINNTILAFGQNALALRTLGNGYAFNNILDGGYIDVTGGEGSYVRSHNLYLKKSLYQDTLAPFTSESGVINATLLSRSNIFSDSDYGDFRLIERSPAIHAGLNIQSFLEQHGFVDLYQNFDFTKDKAGYSWAETPSMGAYEYAAENTPTTYALTVNSSGASSVAISSSTGHGGTTGYTKSVTSGTTVTLTAPAIYGSLDFAGWTGAVTSSDRTISFTMNGNKTVTAAFAPVAVPTYTLAISAANGSVTKRVNGVVTTATSFAQGTAVQLTAAANTGYTFGSWSGSAAGTANPVSLTMDGNKAVTANFTQNSYTLSISAANGSVTKRVNGVVTTATSFAQGTAVQLTAVANTGYTFGSWSGSATGTANPVPVTMDGNKAVTASFTQNTYTLSISATNGSVTKRVNGVVTTATSFAHGATVQLTATANAGYTFGSWSGSIAGTANPVTLTMNGNKVVTANFTANAYTLAVTADNGTVVKSPDKATYAYGETVTLTTTAAVGYAFGSWSGSAAGTATSVTLVMNGNKAVTATFELIPGIEPVAHWVFDEPYQSTVADIVSGQSALPVNDPAWGEGWAGENFIRLDSGRQAVQIPLGQCNPAAGTVALWVLPENSDGTQVLFSHDLIGAANSILLYQNAGHLAIGIGGAHQDSIATLTVGQMHHVAVTWSGTSYAVTVNGVQEAAGTFGGLTQLNDFARVGNYSDPAFYDSTPGFRGVIDDVQLYSQSLSTAQINALFLTHTVRENRPLQFVISGQDLSGNPICYTAQNLPLGAAFDSQTQTFTWRPAFYHAEGRYPLIFTAAGQPDQTVNVSVHDASLAGWYEQFLTRSGNY